MLLEKIQKHPGSFVVVNQLAGSASSSAANYRAACKAKSKADFINKLKIVEEETDESLFWLEFIDDLNWLKGNEELRLLMKEGNELVSMITVSLKTLRG